MALAWIQSVPNFSEGRDQKVISAITDCCRGRKGCHLLDRRADPDHNRLVITLAGQVEPVQEALMAAAAVAVDAIDLNRHQGSHPRIGAVDVIPFIPLSGIDLDACVQLAHDFGQRFWEELQVPVYFYEAAALIPARKNLERIRKGQYEVLKKEIIDPKRKPDLGEARLHLTAGATVIGARNHLVAFNVNLATENIQVAKTIAAALRSASGGLGYVKAIGIALGERHMVQVSCNVIDVVRNPLYRVLEFVRSEARRWGVAVLGTEIYGMAPAAALYESGAYYLQTTEFNSAQVIEQRLLELMGEENL